MNTEWRDAKADRPSGWLSSTPMRTVRILLLVPEYVGSNDSPSQAVQVGRFIGSIGEFTTLSSSSKVEPLMWKPFEHDPRVHAISTIHDSKLMFGIFLMDDHSTLQAYFQTPEGDQSPVLFKKKKEAEEWVQGGMFPPDENHDYRVVWGATC